MNRVFKLYNQHKQPVLIVNKNSDNSYHVKGIKGTQLSHINLTTKHLDDLKNDFELMHYEELGQIALDELINF